MLVLYILAWHVAVTMLRCSIQDSLEFCVSLLQGHSVSGSYETHRHKDGEPLRLMWLSPTWAVCS